MDNYIFSKNTIEFVTVGVEFCALMEKVQESEKEIHLSDFITEYSEKLKIAPIDAVFIPKSKNK